MSDNKKVSKTLKKSDKPTSKPRQLDGPGSVLHFNVWGTEPKNKSGKKK